MKPIELNIAVADKVKALGAPHIVEMVVDRLADAEVTRRADALMSAIRLADCATLELRKLKPDVVTFAPDGTRTEAFTKGVLDSKTKAEVRLAKIESAVANATEGGDFSDLFNLSKANEPDGASKPGAPAGE